MDKDKEVTIKVENYLPLYGLLLSNEYKLSIDGKNLITVAELFEQHPDFELNNIYVEMLNSFDRGSFQKYLKNKKNELEALKFVRELFDEFKDNGGNPLEWIYSTLTDIELNFFNYPALLRGVIQTKLLEWADYYEKIKGTPKPPQPPKTFPEFILHPDRESIAESLKATFRGKKGKSIRLMIEVLKAKALINVIDGDYAELHRAIEAYFNADIGTYTGIFFTYHYKPDNIKCKKDFSDTMLIIENLLNTLKTNQNDINSL